MKGDFIRKPNSDPLYPYAPRVCSRKLCSDLYRPRRRWQRYCTSTCRYRDRTEVRQAAFWAKHDKRVRESRGPMINRLRKYLDGNTRSNPKPRFRHLPKALRPLAAQHLARLIERAQRQGKVLTRQKLASLHGNAAWLALYYRPEKGIGSPHIIWQTRFNTYNRSLRKATAPPPPPRQPRSLRVGPRVNEPQKLLDGV